MPEATITMTLLDAADHVFVDRASLKSTYFPDDFFVKATQSDLSIASAADKHDRTGEPVVTRAIDAQTIHTVVRGLADLVEDKAEETAHALVALSRGDIDPAIVLDILKTGAWPTSGNAAAEAAAFAHHLLKAGRDAIRVESGVTWECCGSLYRYSIYASWDFDLAAPDDHALTIEAVAQILWRVTGREVTTKTEISMGDVPPITLTSNNVRIECRRKLARPGERDPIVQGVDVQQTDQSAPFAAKLAIYHGLRAALVALGCYDPMDRARARKAEIEAAAELEAPAAAARAAALVANAGRPTERTRELERQFARARHAGEFETYYDLWQRHGEQHSTDAQRAEMEAESVRVAKERVESKVAVEALVSSLRVDAPGEVERWADAHIVYLRAFIEDCIGRGEGELTSASVAKRECEEWAAVRAGRTAYVHENPNHVTANHDRYARLFGIHYQTLESIVLLA